MEVPRGPPELNNNIQTEAGVLRGSPGSCQTDRRRLLIRLLPLLSSISRAEDSSDDQPVRTSQIQ